MLEAAYDVARVRAAREKGIEVWVYNGVLPRTGTFLLDADAVSPRVNGWISAMFDVAQWFYWESTYWYDRHGKLPVDPFATAESLHNDDGDWANGDGVLLYPGRQVDAFTEHSLGFDGVIPSVRLKNWRRGLEDAGYIELARARDRMRADAVTRTLIPVAFDAATSGRPASWSSRGKSFFDARRALLAIALGDARPSHEGVAAGAVDAHPRRRASRAVRYCGGALAAALAAGAVAVRNWRRRQRARKGRQEP
jgi:hypothetical protein